jgi:phage terminase large subunit
MKIDFDTYKDRLFNSSYYQIRKAQTRYVVVYGSANSGKSVSLHQLMLVNLLEADYNILMIRKYAADLKDSCYALLLEQAKRLKIDHLFTWRFSNYSREVQNNRTGHKILLKGIDDPDKLKSIVGIKKIVIEEADKLVFEDFLELDRRARGTDKIQIYVIYNPISEKHWIKTTLRNPEHVYYPKTTILKYTYKDNKWATPQDIEALEQLRFISDNHYRIYALGEDGIEDKSKKFAWAFDEAKHTGHVELNTSEVIWLSWDFNVNPISCTAFQYYDDHLYGLRSFKLEHSDTWTLCDHIMAYYPGAIYMVTGDASGDSLNAAFQDQMHNYKIIQQKLSLSNQQMNIPTRNPSHKTNQFLLNAVLLNTSVTLDKEHCQPLIYDLMYVEVNEKKEIIKDRTTESKKSDFLDHIRYLCNVLFDINQFSNLAA